MKKMKKRSIIWLGLIAALLNSCVYSLFPIYTEETLVFKEELLGMWDLGEGSYMIFQKGQEDDKEENEENKELKYSIEIKEGFTMSSDEPVFITENGKKVFNEDSIRTIMLKRMGDVTASNPSPPPSVDKNIIKEQVKEDKLKPSEISYSGSVAVFEEKSYRLTVVDKEKDSEIAYTAHLVDIGGDLFLDLYPITNYDSKNFSENYFPVHTFYKVEVTKDEFTMIHFDLEKLNDLFESNLIRLRHENVEGTILITAQPEELQKFFDKYADDESVFDTIETYKRASI